MAILVYLVLEYFGTVVITGWDGCTYNAVTCDHKITFAFVDYAEHPSGSLILAYSMLEAVNCPPSPPPQLLYKVGQDVED